MSRLQPYHAKHPAPAGGAGASAVPAHAAPGPSMPAGGMADGAPGEASPSIARFGVEAFLFLLLLATLGAIQFQDLFISKKLDLTSSSRSLFEPYWYDDSGNGGHSTIAPDKARPLHWSCDLKPGYAYPFCGYGLLLDKDGNGLGINLADYQEVKLRLRYSGSAKTLRVSLKNSDPRTRAAGAKPNELEVPLRQGWQTVTLKLDELVVADWWAAQNHVPKALGQPQRDNVTALEIQPATGIGA